MHPALGWIIAGPRASGSPPDFVRAVVLLAAMPAGINGYIFATLYNRAVGTAANAALIGTILSVGTITLWLALLTAWS